MTIQNLHFQNVQRSWWSTEICQVGHCPLFLAQICTSNSCHWNTEQVIHKQTSATTVKCTLKPIISHSNPMRAKNQG